MPGIVNVRRVITGKELSGSVISPLSYKNGFSTINNVVKIAVFPASCIGKKAVFLMNSVLNDISGLSLTTPSLVDKTDNWVVIASSDIVGVNTGGVVTGEASVSINTSANGLCAIAAYCQTTEYGSDFQMEL